jgi:membrane protein YqaA with SNARE-associated domain
VLVTLAFTFGAGVLPLLNAEIYLAAVATRISQQQVWAIAIAAGAGQTLGKVVWYYATARSVELPWFRKRLESGRFKASYETWSRRVNGRPWVSAGVMLLSATLGVPPLLVMGAVAGALRMRMWIFASTIMLGRTLQSYAILAGLAMAFHGW